MGGGAEVNDERTDVVGSVGRDMQGKIRVCGGDVPEARSTP